MKKSQLRKIIKESIKELITEQTNACELIGKIQHPQTFTLLTENPQLGDHGISQNFINNMAGRPDNFYTNKSDQFLQKALQLAGGQSASACVGDNPLWQIQLINRSTYAQNCRNNPGTC